MPKRVRDIQVVECDHVRNPKLWRKCNGTNLEECVQCFDMREVANDKPGS